MPAFETESTVHGERSDDLFQLVIIEPVHRNGVSTLQVVSSEDAVMHVTRDEAELFNRIAHQDLEHIFHIVHWGQRSEAITRLVAILILPLFPRLLENLPCTTNCPSKANRGRLRR